MRILKLNLSLVILLLVVNQHVIAQDDGSFTTTVGIWWWGTGYGCYQPEAPFTVNFEGDARSGTYPGGEPDFCIGAGGGVNFTNTFRVGQTYHGHLFAVGGLETAHLNVGAIPDCLSAVVTGGPTGSWSDYANFSLSFVPKPGVTPSVNWQIKDATGKEDPTPSQSQNYTLPADGMSQAIGVDTDTSATFALSGDTNICSFSSADGVATLTAGTTSGTVTVTATDHNDCQIKSFSFTFIKSCTTSPPDSPQDCLSCSSCNLTCNNSVDLRFALGPALNGGNAFLEVESDTPSPTIGTPQSLQCNFSRADLEIITNSSGSLRQVASLDRIIDITTNSASSYTLNSYYPTNAFWATNNLYGFTNFDGHTASPFQTVTVELVGGDINHVRVTDSRNPATADYYWQTNGWALVTGNGLRTETLLVTTNGATYTKIRTIKDAQSNVNYQSIEVWQTNSFGDRLIQTIIGTGAAAKTNAYSYNANGLLQQATRSDGSWDIYAYDSMGRQVGHYSPFLNSAPTTNSSLCRFTASTYTNSVVDGSGDDSTLEPFTPRQVVQYVLGQEVSRVYTVVKSGERDAIQCLTPGASWNAGNNRITVTYLHTDAMFLGKPSEIINSDGTLQIFSYVNNTDGSTETITDSGAPDDFDDDVVDGTSEHDWIDVYGNTTMRQVTDIASGIITDGQLYYYDSLHHLTNTIYLNGTTSRQTYDCCNVESSTAPDGTVTSYGYDNLKRRLLTVVNGITVSNILDANGNVLGTIRYGTDGSVVTNNLSTYDDSGQLTSSTDALGHTTVYTNYFDAVGESVKITTYPDGSTDVETNALDGSLLERSGSAVLPVRYAYGTGMDINGNYCTYVQEIKLNFDGSDSSEWTKTFTDMAGRTTETLYSDNSYSQSIYNSQGQLAEQIDPDGVTTLYQYNDKNQVNITAVDVDKNGRIDFGGLDRVTYSLSEVINDNGVNANCTWTYVWPVDSADAPVLTSLSETSVDGLQTWNVVYNNGIGMTSHSQTAYDSAAGLVTVTATAPDGSMNISTSHFGRQASVVQYDSNKATQIGRTTYGYDAQGRQNTVTDARNGTTTSFYNAADQVVATLTPSPDGIQSGQLTTNILDSMGRVIKTILPDGTAVTNEFTVQSLQARNYGSRTYAAGYGYDYAGRMKTMTNWSGFAAGAGARVTTWNYDGYRGFLTNKIYADGKGTAYGYTAAGRLQNRLWARGTNTVYAYNPAGDLGAVNYSDSTAGVTNSYDRLGRQVAVTNGSTVIVQSYNDAGELLTESYSSGPLNGLSVSNSYDALLRRTSVSLLSGSQVLASTKYTYDAVSRLATVSDGTNGAAYSYVANSPLVGQITFRQNNAVRLTTTKQYDFLNELTAISSVPSADAPVSFNYGYNLANQRIAVTNADNSYWNYGYDFLGQVTSGKKHWSDGTFVAGQQFTYGFDDIGNRTNTASGGDASGANLRSANYTNNVLNQITSRDVPGYVDILGSANPNATVTVNLQRAYRYGNYFQDELSEDNASSALYVSLTNLAVLNNGTNADIVATNNGNIFLPQTPENFGYDNDGNMTNSGRWTIAWDAENRATSFASLSTAPTASKVKMDCAYDWQGRRIQKIVSTNNGSVWIPVSTNRFVYDGWNLVGILDGGNNLLYSFQWGTDLSGSLQGAGGVGGLISMTVYSGANVGTYFYAFDGNGNVAALINAATGTIAEQCEYDVFGNLLRLTGSLASINPFLFSTKFYDLETGFYYYGYRFYDPNTGRWLSRDPMEEGSSANLYAFVSNDGVNNADAFGLWQIQRKGDDDRALVIAEKGDTVATLGKMINLDDSDFTSWLHPVNGGKMPTSASESVPSCQYTIPNVIYIEFGDYGATGGGIFTYLGNRFYGPIPAWRNALTDMGKEYKGKGFKVILNNPSNANIAMFDLNSKNIYGFAYAGHGSGEGGLVFNDKENDASASMSAGRWTQYGIAFLIAYGCSTADEEASNIKFLHYRYSPWEESVAVRGTFTGVYDSVTEAWSNIIESSGTNTKTK